MNDLEQQELALAFARAIIRPGGNALLIDANNRSAGYTPLEDAVASGTAFAVEPRQGIVVVDIDDDADRAWTGQIRPKLEEAGCRFVVTSSGGGQSRGHLWVIAPPGWDNDYTKARLYEAGPPEYKALKGKTQVRATQATRPPYAPHRRNPTRSTVVEPSALEALRLFRSTHRRELSYEFRAKLQWFHPQLSEKHHGKPSRSLTLKRVAAAMVNARWTLEEFRAELFDPKNETARLYFEDHPERRHNGWLEATWKEACGYVRDNPSKHPVSVARRTVERLLTCINDHEWAPRTGATDRAVYRALLDVGNAAGSLTFTASQRQLAAAANVGRSAVENALRRLVGKGLIARGSSGPENIRQGYASQYRLVVPSRLRGAMSGGFPGVESRTAEAGTSAVSEVSEQSKSLVLGAISNPLMGDRGYLMARSTALLDDIFTNGSGLGLSCRETWEALPTVPTKTAEIARLRPGAVRVSTVRTHLHRLREHGFAGRDGHRWWRLCPDEDSLLRTADRLGVHRKTEKRRARHEQEREAFRLLREGWNARTNHRNRGIVA